MRSRRAAPRTAVQRPVHAATSSVSFTFSEVHRKHFSQPNTDSPFGNGPVTLTFTVVDGPSTSQTTGFTEPIPLFHTHSVQEPSATSRSESTPSETQTPSPSPSATTVFLEPEPSASKRVNIGIIIPVAIDPTSSLERPSLRSSTTEQASRTANTTKLTKPKVNRQRLQAAPVSTAPQTSDSEDNGTPAPANQEPQLERHLLLSLMQRFEALEAAIRNPAPASAPSGQALVDLLEPEVEDRPPDYVSQLDSRDNRSRSERLDEEVRKEEGS
ncbi:hypothetical protein NP233_g4236 [Leucocoprinus birnbaumii]|uniref:Uncharacterized protein n=1 Tax=Leucocoprinus birnbaumii TaxID=56174 RepID=A0AAD5VXL3_9AGAR|nr:hypothetical protein NP233_g4236 [Leucocoprinus birnbaumii]